MSGFSWDTDPSSFKDAVLGSAEDNVSHIATQVFRELVTESPVYSGALRACWRVSEGVPKVVSLPGRHKPLSIPRQSLRVLRFKGLKQIYITNGQYYATFVEYGTAKTPPQAFVERAISRALR